jgi:hypothetical protein
MKTDTLNLKTLLQQDQWEPLWDDIRGIAEDLFHDRFRRP